MAAIGILSAVYDPAAASRATSTSADPADVDATNLQIDSGDITGSAKYLVIAALSQLASGGTRIQGEARILAGTSTVVPNSLVFSHELRGNERGFQHHIVFEYTAPSTPVDVRWQHASPSTTEITTCLGYIIMIPVGSFAADDYGYDEDANQTNLTTSKVAFASLAKTLTASDRWLIVGCAAISCATQGRSALFDFISTKGTPTTFAHLFEMQSTSDLNGWPWFFAGTGFDTNTWTHSVELSTETTNNEHVHEFSSIAAINLTNIFESSNHEVTAGPTAISALDTFEQQEVYTHTPTTTGNHVMLGWTEGNGVVTAVSNMLGVFELAGTQTPVNRTASGTSDPDGLAREDSTDDTPIAWAAVESISNAGQSVEWLIAETRNVGASDPDASNNILIVFSDEAVAAGGDIAIAVGKGDLVFDGKALVNAQITVQRGVGKADLVFDDKALVNAQVVTQRPVGKGDLTFDGKALAAVKTDRVTLPGKGDLVFDDKALVNAQVTVQRPVGKGDLTFDDKALVNAQVVTQRPVGKADLVFDMKSVSITGIRVIPVGKGELVFDDKAVTVVNSGVSAPPDLRQPFPFISANLGKLMQR